MHATYNGIHLAAAAREVLNASTNAFSYQSASEGGGDKS